MSNIANKAHKCVYVCVHVLSEVLITLGCLPFGNAIQIIFYKNLIIFLLKINFFYMF